MVTILEALEREFPDSSRTSLRSWIQEGRVSVGGKIIRDPRKECPVGERPVLGHRTIQGSGDAEGIALRTLYRDPFLMMIHKPTGVLSVAAAYEKERSVHRILESQLRCRVFPVHRIDRETSGVLCFALKEETQALLKDLFAAHCLTRRYAAVVEGRCPQEGGQWYSWLLEDPVSYHVREVSPGTRGAQEAITHYETIELGRGRSLLRLTLETGRKHQIRVQAAAAGHPIVGDPRYGSSERRMALHAEFLGFNHPNLGHWIEAFSPAPIAFRTKILRA